MSKMLQAPLSVHGDAMPIPALDFENGLRTPVNAGGSTSVNLPAAGAYVITATTPVFVRQGGAAADAIRSIVIAAGMPVFLQLREGLISFRALSADGSVFVVPLR